MKRHVFLNASLVAAAIALSPLAVRANGAVAPAGGSTSVRLDDSFLSALGSLHVTPAAIGPGEVLARGSATVAAFPITTGGVDLNDTTIELDHAGGLSLSAGSTTVDLTAFVIEVGGSAQQPVLTGLVAVDGKLVGRLPLFDLSLGKAKIWASDGFVEVSNVSLTLDDKAAAALSDAFHTTVPAIPVGIAQVKTVAKADRGL